LSFGVFAKQIDGYIAQYRTDIGAGPDNGWGGLYEGFTLRTQRNLSTARTRGFEFNYDQRLTFLPGAWRGLALNANLTSQNSSGTFDEGLTELPGFKDLLANAGVSYRFRKAQIRINYNYASSALNSYDNTNPYLSVYNLESHTVDVNFQYTLNKHARLFFDVSNLFNEAPTTYVVSPDYIRTYEKNGARVSVGISGRF
jgi:iron complex outermembrane receptor protein